MQDAPNSLDRSLAGLKTAEWKAGLEAIAEDHGMFQPLDGGHFATFVDKGDTLLVTFETAGAIRGLSEKALPYGFQFVRDVGWSHLCVISQGDTWFREPSVYALFDRLTDEAFFDDFDRVLFYGAGPCGYAAAAFSVAAPGARVLAIQPQATLDPAMTEWEDRFPELRRTSFTDRYGYAPDMLDAADRAFILYDPQVPLDAMHATLFQRANVTRLRARNLGGALQTSLIDMGLLSRLILYLAEDRLDARRFHSLWRERRDYRPYLQNLLLRLHHGNRPWLEALLCRNVTRRMSAPKFQRFLDQLEKRAASGDLDLPDETD
ncbi:MAG: phosphoadenosine phosphosulfate reductase [Rhodobacteraceae bacterium]|nr:MAG: phosphoadenosine phosphosulfate reductase [Paracoccaceae bacterium]